MGKYTMLEKKLEREIDEISRKDLSGPSLEMLDKMAHTLKSLKTIDAMEGYSEDDGYHHDAMSYARGRGRYAEDHYGYTEDDGSYPGRFVERRR